MNIKMLAEQKRGLRNFTENIKPIMLKCKDGKKLSKDEQNTIVQFYLEVADFIFKDA